MHLGGGPNKPGDGDELVDERPHVLAEAPLGIEVTSSDAAEYLINGRVRRKR